MKLEDELKMKTCCILSNKHLADVVCEIIDVSETLRLPDGDSINIPTKLWLDDILNKFYGLSKERGI